MSTLQGTFSLMRISVPDVLKLLSFCVPSVISIHFSVFLGYIQICQHTRKVIRLWPATVFLEAISDMEPRCFSGQSLQKNHSQSLFYFKIILHPVSVFLRNYFFLLTASRKKLFPKKTLQTAHEGFKISQMHRLTFHLI